MKRPSTSRGFLLGIQFPSRIAAPLSGACTLLLPKCPVCGIALLHLLGINSMLVAGVGNALFLSLAGILTLPLAIRAFQLKTWTPFCLTFLGAASLVLGRLYWKSTYASIGGVLLLAGGAIWSSRGGSRTPSCAAGERRTDRPCASGGWAM